ncbi:hypothetical protein A9Q62_14460 [Yersinia ruckeri]|nr:hypothetical protein A9Q62_14460 [Yersinia ruckeri]OJB91253.1 hypothetical protein A9Q60_14090 [Yersinia ruckeri]
MNDTTYGELWAHHVEKIETTVKKALCAHPRTFALRVDLHLPDYDADRFTGIDSAVITRFFESLKAKVRADRIRKRNGGGRDHQSEVRYVWTREFEQSGVKPHYHVLILLNKDVYHSLGNYQSNDGTLALMLQQAWYSALGFACPEIPERRTLVYFPDRPHYWLDTRSDNFEKVYTDVMFRARYMAKVRSKRNDDGYRSFGCSQY